MRAPELTLAAALRDRHSTQPQYREAAVRELATALLRELGETPPAFDAAQRHPMGPAVLEALLEASSDPDSSLRGWAFVGLGQLGAVELLAAAPTDLHETSSAADDDARGEQFVRQCIIIALSLLGASLPPERRTTQTEIVARLRDALGSRLPDLRFQAALALVEVAAEQAEPYLVAALRTEREPEVRQHLFEALSQLSPLGGEAIILLRNALADPEEAASDAGYAAALALAGVRRPEAGPRLLAALEHRGERDRALEALAALAEKAPPEAVERVHRMVRSPWTPGVTRVRAAYALSRLISPRTPATQNPGLMWLRRLAWHPSPAVREAIRDAHDALRQLATG